MAGFQPTNIPVKMTAGIDTKSDPKSLQTKLTVLQNASFQNPGEIRKRDGFSPLPALSNGIGVSSFNNELLSMDGTSLYSYSPETNSLINKGPFTPIQLSVDPVIRQSTTQTQADQAYDPVTKLKCFVWIDSVGGGFYSVVDTKTGTNIVFNEVISSSAINCKVILNGNNFVIFYTATGGSPTNLFFAAINTATPTIISSPTLISASLRGVAPVFDCLMSNSNIYVAYVKNTNPDLFINSLSSTLVLSSALDISFPQEGTIVSLASDSSNNIWATIGTGNAGDGAYVAIANSALSSLILSATSLPIFPFQPLVNITTIVSGTTMTLYGETSSNSNSVPNQMSNYITSYQMTISGTPSAGVVIMRGVGLSSKCFKYNGIDYFLTVYDGSYNPNLNPNIAAKNVIQSIQPTYFLINNSGKIIMKLAPSIAAGYSTSGILPEVLNISSGQYSFTYLIEENTNISGGLVVFQIGAMAATINFGLTYPVQKIQFANNLHLASGQLWMYDGQNIVEHGFHIYPENLYPTIVNSNGGIGIGASTASENQVQYVGIYEWIDNQGQTHRSAPSVPLTVPLPANASLTPVSFTGTIVAGSNKITSASVVSNIFVGQVISDTTNPTAFPAGTYITESSNGSPSGTLVASQPATLSSAGDTFQTFDVNEIQILFPTLRQTSKQTVSLVLYRTENNGTIFYRVTSPTVFQSKNGLTLNDTSVDFISIFDALADAAIVGNEQLYTTGGVLENLAAPATSALATFKNRLVYLSPENPTQWGYSQQVVPGVPVEFNSLEFTENVDSQIGQILAAKALDDKLIFFGPQSKYYVVGQGPSPNGVGNDFSDATKIAGVAGCSNPISVIEIPSGLLFQDIEKGIYLLDRALNESYKGADVEQYNGIPITSVQKFENQNKVIFTLNNGVNLIYDWFVDQWEVDPFPSEAVDSTIFQNLLTYIQADGLILQQTPGEFSDNGDVIPIQLQTGWINFTGLEGFGRVWELQLMGTYFSPHTLTINIYTDFDDSNPSQTVVIPVSSPPPSYAFRIRILKQKCTSMMIKITESQNGSPGQGFALSSMAFRVGTKKGLNKLSAGASF